MGDISTKIQKFIEIFIDNNGYVKVVEGLKNTVIIAIAGLIIGIIIGTLIATVRVIPKYKRLPATPMLPSTFCRSPQSSAEGVLNSRWYSLFGSMTLPQPKKTPARNALRLLFTRLDRRISRFSGWMWYTSQIRPICAASVMV